MTTPKKVTPLETPRGEGSSKRRSMVVSLPQSMRGTSTELGFILKTNPLEIEEDPYATLSDDDIVRMEVEVPFNDSDPPIA
ncbi:hypothetical protein B296_00014249 [Ensete ventricosum]|uniref:Uncharacterized protein n=1 Tax=Ensete ventricosum TaxID=4639 RepID=A0A427A9F4_ENSVE|nr:hypothetical protein B296_00014249 [Ensete ventricosum]